MARSRPNIGVVSTFEESGGDSFLLDFVKVLSPASDNIHVIAPNTRQREEDNLHFHPVRYKVGENVLAQVLNQVGLQMRMSYRLARLVRKVDFWIFFGGEVLLLPALTAKLFRVRLALALAGSLEKESQFRKHALNKPQRIFKRINCALADRIILYSAGLVEQWQLGKYQKKILVADRHFLDFSVLRVEKPLVKRDRLVGYIGRLGQEKGVWNLLQAVPILLERGDNLMFLIGGDGPLRRSIREYLKSANLNNRVEFIGWIPHSDLSRYLNELRLLVLPSYTEGMPNIVLEAMACGTPVLATSVGAIPDIIKDGETGFIMEDNSPDCIAKNISRVLEHPHLVSIADMARQLVERQFSFEAAVDRYGRVIAELGNNANY